MAKARSHEKRGTEKLTINVESALKEQARKYAILHDWPDLTTFIHDAIRHAMQTKLEGKR